MKKSILLLLMSALTLSVSAQMMRRPSFRPDWTFQAPMPTNGTYLFVVEQGEGNTKREALNMAIGRVLQSTANRIGVGVSTDEIYRAMATGSDYEVIARNMKIPFNKVCEFAVQDTVKYTWTMYVLCQVAKAGNINVEFDPHVDCTKHEHFKELMAKYQKQEEDRMAAIKKAENSRNATALLASTFIPGSGQMLKGHGGTGAAFLIGEIAIFGGGTACHFLGEEQVKIMKATGTTYADYQKAKSAKNTLDIAMWTCFGVGAAVHIGNMVHAWFVSDRHAPTNLTFAPALIQTNEYMTPSYAMGAGMQIKF
jgi:hypothetical protein